MGPNYHRPQIPVPDQFRNAPVAGPNSIADKKWFDLFQDATLKQLVTTALANNFDVRIAAERVLEARAQYGITRGELFPTLDAQGQFTATRSSSVGSFRFIPAGTNLTTSYTQANLAAVLGARSVGPRPALERSRASAISGIGRSAQWRNHLPDLRRDEHLFRAAGTGPGA